MVVGSVSLTRILAFLFICALPLLWIMPIASSTEAREAQVIDTIVRTGEWVLPSRNGLVPSKPILFHWLGALAAKVLHVTPVEPWLPRLISLCSCFSLTLLVYRLALFRTRERNGLAELPQFTVLILLFTYGFTSVGFISMVDMLFALWITVAIAPWYRAMIVGQLPSGKGWSLFCLAIGFAFLTKGPLAVALGGLMAFSFVVAFYNPVRAMLYLGKPRLSWLLFFVIALPWYYLAMQEGGSAFGARQLWFENIYRFLGGEQINNQPWYYYFIQGNRFGFPLVPLMILGSTLLLYRRGWPEQPREHRALALFIFLATTLFSLSSGKRHSYLLPLYPPLALLCAEWVAVWIGQQSNLGQLRLARAYRCFFYSAQFVGVALLFFIILNRFGSISLPERAVVLTQYLSQYGGVIAVLLALFLIWSLRAKAQKAFPILLLAFIVICSLRGLKGVDRDWQASAQGILHHVGDNRLLVIRTQYEEFFDPVLYYLHRAAELQDPYQPVAAQHPEFILLRKELLPQVGGTVVAQFFGKKNNTDRFLLIRVAPESLTAHQIASGTADAQDSEET